MNSKYIKNRTCYYFNDMIKFKDFELDNILIDQISYKNILVCNILYKNMIGDKPLDIRSDKVNEFIRVYDGIRHLLFFGAEKCDFIYNRIRYLIRVKRVLHMPFLIITQKAKLINMIFCL